MAFVDNGLNPQQIKFCLEYVKDYNGTQAAIRAGYEEKSAHVQASRMLKKDKVKKFIESLDSENVIPLNYIKAKYLQIIEGKEKAADRISALDKLAKLEGYVIERKHVTGEFDLNNMTEEEIDEALQKINS